MNQLLRSMCLVGIALALMAGSAQAATYYWDDNGGAANFGTAGQNTGTWAAPTAGPTAGWSLSGTGANAFAPFTTTFADSLNFGNGATGLGAGTLTISGSVDAGSLTYASGTAAITLSGGPINLAPAATISINNASQSIAVTLAGAATSFTKSGTGTLVIAYADNNYGQFGVPLISGVTTITGGRIKVLGGANGSQHFMLVNSAFDTTGSTGGVGLDLTGTGNATAPYIGGLLGAVDLGTAIAVGYANTTALNLNLRTGNSYTYTGIIANGAAGMGLNKMGSGTQTLTAPHTYSGSTIVYAGTLVLGGANGSVLSSTNVAAKGGVLSLDNSTSWTNRIPDAATFSLGSLTVTSYAGAGIQAETNGATTFAASGKVAISNGATAGDQTTLALGAVTRSAGVAIDFAGTGGTVGVLGSGANSPNVTSSGVWPGAANSILPWATVGGTQWAEDNSKSIRAYSGAFATLSTVTSNTQAQQTGAASPAGSSITNNSLNVIADGSANILDLGNNVVSFGSTTSSQAAILKSGANAYTISASGSGSIRAGTAGAGTELIAHVDGGDLTISAPLNTAILTIAKGGTGKLVLAGTHATTLSGNISTVGTLEFQGLSTTLSGAISGPGGLTCNLNAGQTLTINNTANTYSGPTVVKGGIMCVAPGFSSMGLPTSSPGVSCGNYGWQGLSNLEITNAVVSMAYFCDLGPGPGPGQFQITGGTAGFSATGNALAFNFYGRSSYEAVWGSPYFKPDVLVLQEAAASPSQTLTWNNPIDLNGATRTIAVNAATTVATLPTIVGVIRTSSGTAGLTKIGVGELMLSGANTFNGPVTVSNGTLTVSTLANGGSASGLGSSSSNAVNLLLANATTLRYANGAAVSCNRSFTINGSAAGDSASLDASGTGALSLTNTASPAYGTVDQTRTLILTGTDTHTNTLAAAIADNGGGAVSVTKTGVGTWVLAGASTYTGTTTLNAGELMVSATNNLGGPAANLVLNGGTLGITNTALTSLSGLGHTVSFTPGAAVNFDIASAANAFTVDQTFTGATLTKSGAGTLVLGGTNGWTGLTTINSGTLQYNDYDVVSTMPLFNNGVLIVNRSTGYDLTQGVNFHCSMYGSGSLTKTNTGTLFLNDMNPYTGTTKVMGGKITVSHAQALMNSVIDTTGTGAFTFDGVTAPVIGGLSGNPGSLATSFTTGYGSVTNLILNPNYATTWTFGGDITNGAMNLTITGSGTQIFTNSNTYSGATILSAATLQLSGNGRLTTSALTPSGGTLLLVNTTAADAAINRLSDSAPITANGGTITFQNTVGSTIYSETNGAVTLASGQLNIVENNNQNSTGSQTLTLADLTHTGAGNSSVITFSSAGTRTTKNMIVVSAAAVTATDKIIGPWATIGTTAALQTDYAIYNGSNQVVDRNTGATTSDGTWNTTWADTNNYNFANTTVGTTLTSTKNINTLRHSGGIETLTVATGANLGTLGILNGVANLLTIAATGSGVVTLPTTAPDNLYVTTGSGAITISAPIMNNTGALTLVSSGSGTLTLSSTTSDYSGGTVLNAGILAISADSNLGNTSGGITFNGPAALQFLATATFSSGRTVTLNNGANAVFFISDQYTIANNFKITGNGGIQVYEGYSIKNGTFTFSNPASDFTGSLNIGNFSSIGNTTLNLTGLVDGPGCGDINFWASVAASLTLNYQGSSALNLANRRIVINTPASQTVSISTYGGPITIAKDLLVVSGGAKTLSLGGTSGVINYFNGKIQDGLGSIILTKAGTTTWVLSNTNTFSGATTISGGILSVNSIANVGGVSALGMPATVANGTIGISGTLQYTGSGHTSDRVISMSGATTLDASGTGALVLTSPLTGAQALTLMGTSTATNTLSGTVPCTTLTKSGLGTWILSGSNAVTGVSAVNGGGTLVLDYTTQNYRKLASSQALTLSGGTVTLKNGSYTEVANGMTMSTAGGNFLNRSGSSTGTITLGGLTRSTAGSTIDFADNAIADTTQANVSGILGGWATVGGTNWAVSGTHITNYLAYTALPAGAGSTLTNYLLTGSQTRTNPVSANALKLANSGNGDTLALGTNNLTIYSASATALGGILYAGGNDNNYTISGSIGRILPSGGTPQELIINVSTGTLTVSALVAANASASPLTKTGPGTLVLGNTNNYTGATYVNQGALRLTNALGAAGGAINVQNGAAVELAGGIRLTNTITMVGSGVSGGGALRNVSGNNTYGGALTVGTGGMRINSDGGLLILTNTIVLAGNTLTIGGAGNVIVSNVISGAGNLIKDGAGTLTLATNNTYTGSTTINGGTLALGINNALPGATAVTINDQGTLDAATFTNTLGTLAISGIATINLGTGAKLAFADSHLMDWSAGTLRISGKFALGSSLRFGTSSSGLTSTQLAKISTAGYSAFSLDANGYLTAQQGGTTIFFR